MLQSLPGKGVTGAVRQRDPQGAAGARVPSGRGAVKRLLLLLVLQVASLAPANGQEKAQGTCHSAQSLELRQSGREAFDKHQYQAAAGRFSEALEACPSQRDV